MSDEKKYKVRCLKAINISGVPRANGEEVFVHEKDARDLVLRKRVIALNYHIDYNRTNNIVMVVEGTTKNQEEKLAELEHKEKKQKEASESKDEKKEKKKA